MVFSGMGINKIASSSPPTHTFALEFFQAMWVIFFGSVVGANQKVLGFSMQRARRLLGERKLLRAALLIKQVPSFLDPAGRLPPRSPSEMVIVQECEQRMWQRRRRNGQTCAEIQTRISKGRRNEDTGIQRARETVRDIGRRLLRLEAIKKGAASD
ncbi:hypothetical protein DPMN_068890 [Dreissena polymorpha]|uniref:Uncharacterized protein n=1 Tax=Dreissena polymorpha TaxID=45954 RepID=A0A9D4BUL0_DREPO|nr:hypothetical protein DPMN_068890 [Dreissena polymorpha]